jgi:hypothetical protein
VYPESKGKRKGVGDRERGSKRVIEGLQEAEEETYRGRWTGVGTCIVLWSAAGCFPGFSPFLV